MKDFLNNIVESIETVIDNIPDQPMENITIDMLQVCPIDDHITIGVEQIMSNITILL